MIKNISLYLLFYFVFHFSITKFILVITSSRINDYKEQLIKDYGHV